MFILELIGIFFILNIVVDNGLSNIEVIVGGI